MIAGYMLAFGLALITGGRVGDLYGRRRTFLTGVATFTVSSLLAGVATTPSVLIAMRVLQGLAAAIMVAALLGVLLSLVQGRELGWPLWVMGMMGASVPLFAWFIRHERRRERRDAAPLVPLQLFEQRAFWSGLVACAVFFGATAGFFITLTITLQLGLGFSALRTGLALIPFSVAAAIGSTISIALAKRAGRTVLQAGVTVLVSVSRYSSECSSRTERPSR
jgi:predicted MFS family arabinose efflux permease